MERIAREYNFDGLVGPTHNYSGLSFGNVASLSHQFTVSNPKEAALQGLAKMKRLAEMGLGQGVLPPQERPDIDALKRLGFQGSVSQILSNAKKDAPELLSAICSASSMWTANAATVAPSADTADQKIHFTPANLVNKFHRSIEAQTTGEILKVIFKDQKYFVHHSPLPGSEQFGDEGAANHTRFCSAYGERGLQFFVYGRKAFWNEGPKPKKYPARQTFEASQAVARCHQLDSQRVVFAQQNPDLIDSGVFHNDVASVGNQNVFFYHEAAFYKSDEVIRELSQKFQEISGHPLVLISVPTAQVSVEEAVKSYLFNSQLVTLAGGDMALIVPSECHEFPSVKKYLEECLSLSTPLKKVEVMNLRQSMRNGGGPACLRLRVVLTEKERLACNPRAFMDDSHYEVLCQWVRKHYRDRLSFEDLADPQLVKESRTALDELTQILGLGSVYSFQKGSEQLPR